MEGNPWNAMRNALDVARSTQRAVADHARVMANMLVGNLRKCNHEDLEALKRELAGYNIHTRKWKRP